jgi:microcompartment protein CcmK/EutM
MKMVKIIGSVTSTIKDDSLKGFKLLFVQAVDLNLNGTKEYYIVVDTVGLGEGEVGLIVTGSTAKMTQLTADKNVDGTLVAKVERIDLESNG